MTVKKVFGLLILNDGILAVIFGLYRIITDITTPGRYNFNLPWTPHEWKYILFTLAGVVACIVGIILFATKSKPKIEEKQ